MNDEQFLKRVIAEMGTIVKETEILKEHKGHDVLLIDITGKRVYRLWDPKRGCHEAFHLKYATMMGFTYDEYMQLCDEAEWVQVDYTHA